MDGGAGSDTLQLAVGSHTFATDTNLVNVEAITLGNGTNTLDLTNQTEAFTITGGTGADTITGGAGADIITGGAGADRITAGNGDTLIFATAHVLVNAGVAAGTSVTADLRGTDIITGPTTTGETLILNFAAMDNTIANATITQGTTVLMAGATANNFLINQGTYNAGTGVFTGTGTTPTHTLITVDTNGATAGGVANILLVGVFASAVVASEILTLTV
jgi:S-layer protein